MKRTAIWGMILLLTLCSSMALAQPVTVQELRQQLPQDWNAGEILLPELEKVPVAVVDPPEAIRFSAGTFDESASGSFVRSSRYGSTPPRTALKNGLTLQQVQQIMNDELQARLGLSAAEYGPIWTEIAEWKQMETWLLYYGQRFFGLTCFDAGLTIDARTESYRYMIVPHWRVREVTEEDVPLAAWETVRENVEQKLAEQALENVVLELGYLLSEQQALAPVWMLSGVAPSGYTSWYFSAQTGKKIVWLGKAYAVPEPFGWQQ